MEDLTQVGKFGCNDTAPNRDSYGGHEKNQGWEYQNISVFVSGGLLFWALHGSTKWSNPQGLNVTSHPIPCKSCPLLSFVLIEPRCLSISLCHMTPCFRAWSPLRSWPQPPKVTNSSPIVGWMATEAWPFKKISFKANTSTRMESNSVDYHIGHYGGSLG